MGQLRSRDVLVLEVGLAAARLGGVIQLPDPPSRSVASDNAAGAHPAVLQAIVDANDGHQLAYGSDTHTAECEDRMRDLFGRDVVTRLCFNGTGANVAALAALMGVLPGPNHAIVCADRAHIATDEAAAPERVLATKLIGVPSPDAKLTPEMIDDAAASRGVVHFAQPGIVSITQPTELGALYTADEIAAVCDAAKRHGMLVHLDGARLANATAALGGTRAALRSFTVDVGVDALSFGVTKNGALGAEAVVFLNPELGEGSEYVRKQVTQLASKMRFLAAQFNALLHDDLWIDLGAHANDLAVNLYSMVNDIDGIDVAVPEVNSLFPILSPQVIEPLREWCFFWDWNPSIHQVRWMTAWDTTADDLERFAAGLRTLIGASS